METTMRQTWAFLFRGYHITRRYIGWVVVFNFYALVTSATVALIGVAAGNYQMTLTLVVGALLWNYLSWLYNEIAMSIAYERWEGTLEYTFMAPVSRSVHLLGVSLFSLLNSILTSVIVLLGLMAVHESQPARREPRRRVRGIGREHDGIRRTRPVCSRVPGDERGTRRGSDAHLSRLASTGFRRLLSHRRPARLDAAVIGDFAGNLHAVCLPEVIRSREQCFNSGASRRCATVGSHARAAGPGGNGRDTVAARSLCVRARGGMGQANGQVKKNRIATRGTKGTKGTKKADGKR